MSETLEISEKPDLNENNSPLETNNRADDIGQASNAGQVENTARLDNVDRAEIAHFEKLAHRWWDPTGDFKPLHDMNPLRAQFIDQNSPVAGKNIIDIGCGGGILTENLCHRGATMTGIDMGEAPLSVARLHALEADLRIDYQQITAEAIAEQQPEQYDIVTCLEMLEHVPDPSSVIASCAKLCKPGGHIYFSTLNRNPKSWLFSIVGAEYILQLLPKGTHQYEKFIKPSELCQWARDNKLIVKAIKGMLYNPLTKHFSLSDTDTDVNYLVHTQKPH